MDITSTGAALQSATSSAGDGSRQQAALASGGAKSGLLKESSLSASMALQLVQSAAQTTGGHIDIYA